MMELDEMDELRIKTYTNAKLYNERTKVWHDKHILAQNFDPGHNVYSIILDQGYSLVSLNVDGLAHLMQAFLDGAVEIVDEKNGTQFKVNL